MILSLKPLKQIEIEQLNFIFIQNNDIFQNILILYLVKNTSNMDKLALFESPLSSFLDSARLLLSFFSNGFSFISISSIYSFFSPNFSSSCLILLLYFFISFDSWISFSFSSGYTWFWSNWFSCWRTATSSSNLCSYFCTAFRLSALLAYEDFNTAFY